MWTPLCVAHALSDFVRKTLSLHGQLHTQVSIDRENSSAAACRRPSSSVCLSSAWDPSRSSRSKVSFNTSHAFKHMTYNDIYICCVYTMYDPIYYIIIYSLSNKIYFALYRVIVELHGVSREPNWKMDYTIHGFLLLLQIAVAAPHALMAWTWETLGHRRSHERWHSGSVVVDLFFGEPNGSEQA